MILNSFDGAYTNNMDVNSNAAFFGIMTLPKPEIKKLLTQAIIDSLYQIDILDSLNLKNDYTKYKYVRPSALSLSLFSDGKPNYISEMESEVEIIYLARNEVSKYIQIFLSKEKQDKEKIIREQFS
jgi:hypothetical protein